jgi:hypothetical protein
LGNSRQVVARVQQLLVVNFKVSNSDNLVIDGSVTQHLEAVGGTLPWAVGIVGGLLSSSIDSTISYDSTSNASNGFAWVVGDELVFLFLNRVTKWEFVICFRSMARGGQE